MAKWNFFVSNTSLIKELDTSGNDVNPQSQSFLSPTLDLQGDKIVFKESGAYKTALLFTEIGEIAGDTPTDLQDAYDRLIALLPDNGGGGGSTEPKTVQTTGSVISFSTRQRYNSIASPTSENITDNLTGARIGVVQKIFSNRSTTPTFPSGWVKRGSGNYIPSTLNIIYAEWEEGTTVSYWITQ